MNLRDGMTELVGLFRAAHQETKQFLTEDVLGRSGAGPKADTPNRAAAPGTAGWAAAPAAAEEGRAR
jgi:hypothetical protein